MKGFRNAQNRLRDFERTVLLASEYAGVGASSPKSRIASRFDDKLKLNLACVLDHAGEVDHVVLNLQSLRKHVPSCCTPGIP